MKHLGDITKLNGAEVPIVDVICGGSPCQDLSVAGKRAGLAGERSGLFMDQIRIIKEMREHDRAIKGSDVNSRLLRPRYMVWENVPGAFSSNKGEDFRAVLEETAKVVCEDAIIPRPTGGKWSPSGCIMGDGWSIAWRVHDAQFWGVPQRRKRIALVADFGGLTAPEILFEREGVSRDSAESKEQGQGISPEAGGGSDSAICLQGNGIDRADTAGCNGRGWRVGGSYTLNTIDRPAVVSFQERAGCAGGARESSYSMSEQEPCPQSTIRQYCLNDQGGSVMGVSEGVTGALRAQEHGHQPIVYGISSYESNAMKSSNPHSGIYEADTSRTLDLNGGSPACNQGGMVVLEGNGSRPSHQGDGYKESEVSYTLNSTEQHAVCYENIEGGAEPITASKAGFFLNARNNGKADTLVATDYKDPQVICYGLDRASFNQGRNAQYGFSVTEEQAQTLVSKGPGGGINETVGALCARKYKGVGSQYVDEGKCIIQNIRESSRRQ